MEYAEEILKRADFSQETDLKRRLAQRIEAGISAPEKNASEKNADGIREISLDDLMKKTGAVNPEDRPSKRRVQKNPVELSFGGVKNDPPEIQAPTNKGQN